MINARGGMLSVVIPAYNEEVGITKTISDVPRQALEKAGRSVEIVVVDNNSVDGTAAAAARLGARVVSERTQGYGAAYKKGISAAAGELVVTADADGTYPLCDIPRLLAFFEQNKLDFLTTNRFAGSYMTLRSMPLVNRIGNMALSFLVRLLFGARLKDSQSGMWVFKKGIFDGLEVKSNNMGFSQEIKLAVICAKRYKWAEIDIDYHQRIGDRKLKIIRDGLSNVIGLFMKRLSL